MPNNHYFNWGRISLRLSFIQYRCDLSRYLFFAVLLKLSTNFSKSYYIIRTCKYCSDVMWAKTFKIIYITVAYRLWVGFSRQLAGPTLFSPTYPDLNILYYYCCACCSPPSDGQRFAILYFFANTEGYSCIHPKYTASILIISSFLFWTLNMPTHAILVVCDSHVVQNVFLSAFTFNSPTHNNLHRNNIVTFRAGHRGQTIVQYNAS